MEKITTLLSNFSNPFTSNPIFDEIYFGNSLGNYLFSFLILLSLFITLRIFRKLIVKKIIKFAERTENKLDDELIGAVNNIRPIFYWILALYPALKRLSLPDPVNKVFDIIFGIIIIVETIKIAQSVLESILGRSISKGDTTMMAGIRIIIRIVLWSIGLLLLLDNLGMNISALIASMGIGGIAIALAAQNILGDLLASFSIYFDKPFQIGDFIVVGAESGTVKKIGIKSTRIATLLGEELIISNKELINARVQNFKKLKRRRVVFSLGVVYSTKTDKLKKIPEIIKTIIESKNGLATPDRVTFKSFGDFSLNFEVVYYAETKDYAEYANLQHNINLDIKEAFEKEKIDMAFPTQTIHLEK